MISILMTLYKEPLDWVKKSISSISNQTTNESIELVLVIDNPDYPHISEVKSIVKFSFERSIVIVNDVNRGLVDSLNIAFSNANGNYIARMDSDDIALSNRFEKELTFLKINNLDFVASSIILVSEKEEKIVDLSFSGSFSGKYLNCVQKNQNQFWHPTWLMKKEVMVELGGYRAISSVEDYDFVLRALSNDFRLGLLGSSTLKKRFNNQSISEMDNYRQSVYTKWLMKMYRSEKASELKDLPIINKKREKRFYEIKKLLNNRKNMTLCSNLLLFIKLIFSVDGRYILRGIFIQKYQIKMLNIIKNILAIRKRVDHNADY